MCVYITIDTLFVHCLRMSPMNSYRSEPHLQKLAFASVQIKGRQQGKYKENLCLDRDSGKEWRFNRYILGAGGGGG